MNKTLLTFRLKRYKAALKTEQKQIKQCIPSGPRLLVSKPRYHPQQFAFARNNGESQEQIEIILKHKFYQTQPKTLRNEPLKRRYAHTIVPVRPASGDSTMTQKQIAKADLFLLCNEQRSHFLDPLSRKHARPHKISACHSMMWDCGPLMQHKNMHYVTKGRQAAQCAVLTHVEIDNLIMKRSMRITALCKSCSVSHACASAYDTRTKIIKAIVACIFGIEKSCNLQHKIRQNQVNTYGLLYLLDRVAV